MFSYKPKAEVAIIMKFLFFVFDLRTEKWEYPAQIVIYGICYLIHYINTIF